MSAARARTPLVLVTGGKGGVGKTTLAANLGVALARMGRAPVLCDLDFGLADLSVVLKLAPAHDSDDFFAGRRTLEECLVEGPLGLRVLAAGEATHDPVHGGERRARLLAALAALPCAGGPALADSPAGIGPDVLDVALHAARVLLVTTPDPAALADAYRVVKAVDARAREAGREVPTPEVFVNLAADAAEARAVAERLRSACERFLARSPRLVGWMPRSRGVLCASARQEPFLVSDPGSLATRAVLRLARRFSDLAILPGASAPAHGSVLHVR